VSIEQCVAGGQPLLPLSAVRNADVASTVGVSVAIGTSGELISQVLQLREAGDNASKLRPSVLLL